MPEFTQPEQLTGWGRTAPTVANVARPYSVRQISEALAEPLPRGAIARGLGRAYGDAAQNAGGLVLECLGLDALGEISTDGVVTVGGGLSLDVLARAAIAAGWFLPVTPGTRHITVGGAVASDVHGKNHHVDGSFSRYVRSMRLALPGGEVRELTSNGSAEDAALFWATTGGMGLTGTVVEATLQLTPAETRFMLVDTDRARNLDELMTMMSTGDDRYRYTVAWVDMVTRGRSMGRGVLTRGDHAPFAAIPERKLGGAREYSPRALVPAAPPIPAPLISRLNVRAFNELWFRKASAHRVDEIQPIETFFYPLDGIDRWNTVYGSRGFLQWQCVILFGEEERLRAIIEAIVEGPVPATLVVLKRFGAASEGPLSFPIPGWTLAVDFPAVKSEQFATFLDALDLEVADAGGRIYLAKDSRMRAELLPAMYPRLAEWRAVQASIDPHGQLTSDLDRRLGITSRSATALGLRQESA